MRYTSYRRYEHCVQDYIPVTVLHLDCAHQVTYYGSPDTSEAMLKENGGTSSGGLTRCKECSWRLQALVQENIAEARRRA
jgi:hypothetical protein